MGDDTLDTVSDTIGFLLARIKGDAEAAMTIMGEGETFKGPELLLGMTDLAYGMVMTFCKIARCTPEEFVRTMAMGAKMMGER